MFYLALNFTLDRSRILIILGVAINAKMRSRRTCKCNLFLVGVLDNECNNLSIYPQLRVILVPFYKIIFIINAYKNLYHILCIKISISQYFCFFNENIQEVSVFRLTLLLFLDSAKIYSILSCSKQVFIGRWEYCIHHVS